MVNPAYGIRRVCLSCNNVVADHGNLQLNMFEDTTKQLRNKALQETMLGIKAKYGKNAFLRGISYTPESTAREPTAAGSGKQDDLLSGEVIAL